MTSENTIRPFRIEIGQEALDDLHDRLRRTRYTPDAPAAYGVPLSEVRRLAEYWRDGYDWRAAEARLNEHPQFVTEIDGQDIHFLHVKSADPDAIPLILTHGWPGSVVEFGNIIGLLTSGSPAFHLVIPSLPGFGFSSPLRGQGWSTARTAGAWAELMRRLGYQRYGAAGNDAGSMISPEVGRLDPEHVIGVHVTQVFSFPSGDPAEFEGMSAEDGAAMGKLQWFLENKISFNQLHSQQPQTLAHALADSPAGLLGWHLQLMAADAMGDKALDDDFILTNTALYWLTNTGGTAIRFYYEDAHGPRPSEPTTVPLGVAGFAGDFSGVRKFAERDHKNIVQWNLHPEPGGHYAAHLEPAAMADDIREFFGNLSRAQSTM
ncbi:MAG TPA: epoxide hydrolase [Streptosporangiaceae bacterium]|nr:epoxide hydrolase [Streptosporangiaceae bacterium]